MNDRFRAMLSYTGTSAYAISSYPSGGGLVRDVLILGMFQHNLCPLDVEVEL